MSRYIVRNGGFNLKNAKKELPTSIKEGTKILCMVAASTLTKGKEYTVMGHFCYLNTYGERPNRYTKWDEFYTLKNDQGYTIKVNARKFWICPTDAMEVLRQAL